jgi:hypothetical protein
MLSRALFNIIAAPVAAFVVALLGCWRNENCHRTHE